MPGSRPTHDFGGPQKFHFRAVPRVGGIGIALGLVAGVVALGAVRDEAEQRFAALLLLCGIPGLRQRPVRGRLEARRAALPPGRHRALGAARGLRASDAIGRPHRPLGLRLDRVVHGRRGLPGDLRRRRHRQRASTSSTASTAWRRCACVMMLVAIAYVGLPGRRRHRWRRWRWRASAPCSASSSGTFPAGLIFLGDGGAYFLGFYVAELGILLLAPQPARSRRCSRC